jgi:hypothetical protein
MNRRIQRPRRANTGAVEGAVVYSDHSSTFGPDLVPLGPELLPRAREVAPYSDDAPEAANGPREAVDPIAPALAPPAAPRSEAVGRVPEAAGRVPVRDKLLWGWSDIVALTGLSRRLLEREVSAGRMPAPDVKICRRRALWRPATITEWLESLARQSRAGGGAHDDQ